MNKEENNKRLVIAFGKGKLFNEAINNFHFTPNNDFMDFVSDNIPIFHDSSNNLTCVTVRHSDLPWMLINKYVNVAIGSSIWFLNESNSTLKKACTIKTKPYHLALISKHDVGIRSITKVVTKFAKITKKYFDKIGQEVDIIPMNGSHEIALSLEIADAIIDVVGTGRIISKMNLQKLDVLYNLNHEVWIRNDKEFKNNLSTVEHLLSPK